ncbi:MAG TPA: hypothetical protein EYN51_09105 [Flavobacteriales bacterium]|nr:hypothetical protein [Flavobacteriales bacterium]HIA11067.1 hypothetical protein [Flavobacteriales bacterium]
MLRVYLVNKENIFIHIPKTGGTTINTTMVGTYWANEPNFHYRHIVLKEKRSNSGDIFDPANCEKYKAYNILMMLRDPVDRLISEYYFLKERKNFMDLLRKPPRDFNDYIINPQTQNYMVGFLVGKRIFDVNPTKEFDLDRVLDAIENIPIHVGIFEKFEESLLYYQKKAGIKWNKKMEVKRMTFNRPAKESISDETKELILEKNYMDSELYDYCLDLFNSYEIGEASGKFSFVKNKYDHVIPYTTGICFFEFCMENKRFLKHNLPFFKAFTFYLHKDLKIRDGKTFVQIWNQSFVNTINHSFPNTSFSAGVTTALQEKTDPLEQTIHIAKATDQLLQSDSAMANQVFLKQLEFDNTLVEQPKRGSKGFWNKILGG